MQSAVAWRRDGRSVGDPNATDSVLDNDVDPDGDALTASKLTNPGHGALIFNADGTFTYQNNDSALSDSFLYSACDSHGACALGVVSITIGTVLRTIRRSSSTTQSRSRRANRRPH